MRPNQPGVLLLHFHSAQNTMKTEIQTTFTVSCWETDEETKPTVTLGLDRAPTAQQKHSGTDFRGSCLYSVTAYLIIRGMPHHTAMEVGMCFPVTPQEIKQGLNLQENCVMKGMRIILS